MVRLIDRIVRRQIVAGEKTRPGAAQNRDRDSGIAIGRLQRIEDFSAQAIVQRVALVGPVQRDAPDPGLGSSTRMC
jgi:hypothetical protein